ncbi:MAG: DUF6452 family protein [Prevotella sp.]|jgi:hypothetical protein
MKNRHVIKHVNRFLGRMSALAIVAACMLMVACSSIDCPLNNVVYTNYILSGPVDTLTDTLTISTTRRDGFDSVIINKQVNTDSFSLPISYGGDEDVFFFNVNGTMDTVRVSKTNEPHFESVDCGLNYFHTLTGVRFTRHTIDSIVIHQPKVNYDVTQQHFFIYFKEYRY